MIVPVPLLNPLTIISRITAASAVIIAARAEFTCWIGDVCHQCSSKRCCRVQRGVSDRCELSLANVIAAMWAKTVEPFPASWFCMVQSHYSLPVACRFTTVPVHVWIEKDVFTINPRPVGTTGTTLTGVGYGVAKITARSFEWLITAAATHWLMKIVQSDEILNADTMS